MVIILEIFVRLANVAVTLLEAERLSVVYAEVREILH